MDFLRFERQRRGWARNQPLEADRLARMLAIAVLTLIDPADR